MTPKRKRKKKHWLFRTVRVRVVPIRVIVLGGLAIIAWIVLEEKGTALLLLGAIESELI